MEDLVQQFETIQIEKPEEILLKIKKFITVIFFLVQEELVKHLLLDYLQKH